MADVVVGSTFFVTLTSESLLNQGLKRFLQAWENLQVVNHVVLIDVSLMASAESFTRELMQILQADFIDAEAIIADMFKLHEAAAVNIHFDACGYESSDFVKNMSSTCFFVLVAHVFVLLMFFLSIFCCWERVKIYAKR